MIDGQSYSIYDFFSRYPKKQWERADSLQQEKMLDDFIGRELCVLEAKGLGFLNDPGLAVKIFTRSRQILINESYKNDALFWKRGPLSRGLRYLLI